MLSSDFIGRQPPTVARAIRVLYQALRCSNPPTFQEKAQPQGAGPIDVSVPRRGWTRQHRGVLFSRTRGIAAAKAFFRKALKHHPEPHRITLDGQRPSHSALRRMGMNGEFNFRGRAPVKIRCCQYLNNIVEQDHRRVKLRLRPMLGFKTFYNARRVIVGIELAQKIHKRQFAIPIKLQSNPAVIWHHVMAG